MQKKIISAVLSIVLLFSFALSASAKTVTTPDFKSISKATGVSVEELMNNWAEESQKTQAQKDQESYKELARLLGKSVEEVEQGWNDSQKIYTFLATASNGLLIFDEKSAREANVVSSEVIDSVVNDINNINNYIESNRSVSSFSTLASCVGESTYNEDAFAQTAKFDSCEANQIVGAIAIAASATTIASIIAYAIFPPAGVALSIATALLGMAGGYVAMQAANGCGIVVKKWLGFFPWNVSSQC